MVVYYPFFFPKNGNKEQTALRIRRSDILLDKIIESKNTEKNFDDSLFAAEKEILENDKPNVWNVWKEGNMERVLEVDFQKFAISIVKETGQVIENITTFTFYATVECLKDEHKNKNKNGKRNI